MPTCSVANSKNALKVLFYLFSITNEWKNNELLQREKFIYIFFNFSVDYVSYDIQIYEI